MTTFFDRSIAEQEIICKAYEFEIDSIRSGRFESNPYAKDLKAMGVWEAFNDAIDMAFN